MRGRAGDGGGRGRAAARLTSPLWSAAILAGAALVPRAGAAQDTAVRLDRGRFTVVAFERDLPLARTLLASAAGRDTFPGLPRPVRPAIIAIAPDNRRFREWTGTGAPEWGAAIAFPESHRIVMQGRSAGSDAGDPVAVLRHELAHLALHEALADLPPRWFDEGYASVAAGEWSRDEVLATNVALALRGMPSLAALDSGFLRGAGQADASYALAYRAVSEMASLDPDRGFALFFQYWRESRSLDRAMRSAYGITLDGFQRRWQERTRRRYGGLALFADLTLSVVLLLVLLLPLVIARRRRDRLRMSRLVAADLEAERRARADAIEELLRQVPPPATDRPPGPADERE